MVFESSQSWAFRAYKTTVGLSRSTQGLHSCHPVRPSAVMPEYVLTVFFSELPTTKVVKVLVQKSYPFSKRRDSRHYRVNEPQLKKHWIITSLLPKYRVSEKLAENVWIFKAWSGRLLWVSWGNTSLCQFRGGMQLSSTLYCTQTSGKARLKLHFVLLSKILLLGL